VEKNYSQFVLAKYFVISIVMMIIIWIIGIKFHPMFVEGSGAELAFVLLLIFSGGSYYFSALMINLLFFKGLFNRSKIYIVNVDAIIPIINLKFLFSAKHDHFGSGYFQGLTNIFMSAIVAILSPYTVYYFIKNNNKN